MTDKHQEETQPVDELTREIYSLLDSLFIAEDEEGNPMRMEEIYEGLNNRLQNLIHQAVEDGVRSYKEEIEKRKTKLKSEIKQDLRLELNKPVRKSKFQRVRNWVSNHITPILCSLAGVAIVAVAAILAGGRQEPFEGDSGASNDAQYDFNLDERLGMLG